MRRITGVVLGIALVVASAEIGLKVAAPHLPDPAPWPSPETRLKAAQIAGLGCVDVVLLGTSATEAAVIPELLPVGAYNAALPFATFESLAYWYEEFVAPTLCHSVVVVGVPLWASGEDEFDPLLSGLGAVVDYRGSDGWLDGLLAQSELYRRGAQLKAISEQRGPAYRPEDTGFWGPLGNQRGYADGAMASLPPPSQNAGDGGIDVEGLEKLLEVIRSRGNQAVLMIEPARCGPQGDCPSRVEMESRLANYRAVAQTADVDFVHIGVFDQPDEYADRSHLNWRGASSFTRLLGQAMEATP